MKKISEILKNFRLTITKYIYTNRLFLTYLVLALCGTIIVRNVTINGSLLLKPMFTDIGLILLIGSLGYIIKPKNQFKYFFIWLVLLV